MADTVGFEIEVEVLFGTNSPTFGPVPPLDGFELPELGIQFGAVGVAEGESLPSSLGFELDVRGDLDFADPGLVDSRDLPRTQGFDLGLGLYDYKMQGDTAFEIIFVPPEVFVNSIEVLMNSGDIRLGLTNGVGILNMNGTDLERDEGLETAMFISLFSDKRASLEELQIAGLDDTDQRGYWGDEFEELPIGSHVWLMSRAKIIVNKTLEDFRKYALESWAWLITDGLAKKVEVTVTRADTETLLLTGILTRPDGAENVSFKYYFNWKAQSARRA